MNKIHLQTAELALTKSLCEGYQLVPTTPKGPHIHGGPIKTSPVFIITITISTGSGLIQWLMCWL